MSPKVWDPALPQRVWAEGYQRSGADAVQMTQMGAGTFKTQLKTVMAAEPMQGVIKVDARLLARFWTFFRVTTRFGADPFFLPDQIFDGRALSTAGGSTLTTRAGRPILMRRRWPFQARSKEARPCSRGDLYDAMGIRLLTPGSSKDELPSTSLEMDNIDPSLIRAIQMSPFRAALDLEVVLSSAPDEVVESWPAMEITEASFDDDVVTLSVGYASQAEEPAMMHRMTVNVFPATRAAA